MREIKFRVWNDEIMEYEGGDKTVVFRVKDGKVFTLHTDGLFFPKDSVVWCEDRNAKIMQYTGLKDKNGKEIYEGDWVKSSNKGTREIFWDEDGCMFDADGTYLTRMNDREVIGNIYENPELLD